VARGLRVLSQKFTSNDVPPPELSSRDLRFLPPSIAVAPEYLTAPRSASSRVATRSSISRTASSAILRNGIVTR
jgi:hypothetical protein